MAIHDVVSNWAQQIGGLEKTGKKDGTEATGFTDYLKNSVNHVDKLLNASDNAAVELATGKTENLHEAMIHMEKADTALKLMVQIRNKAIEAYHEIIRMQV